MLSYTTRTALEEATPILLLQCALHDDIFRVCASAGVAWTNGRMRRVRTARTLDIRKPVLSKTVVSCDLVSLTHAQYDPTCTSPTDNHLKSQARW